MLAHCFIDDICLPVFENIYILINVLQWNPSFKTKSEWGGLKRGVVSREGFATFNTRGRLQRLTLTLGGAYNH